MLFIIVSTPVRYWKKRPCLDKNSAQLKNIKKKKSGSSLGRAFRRRRERFRERFRRQRP